MEKVLDFLDDISLLELGLRAYLKAHLKTKVLDKGVILLREGDIADEISFIEKGLIRSFRTMKNDTEKTCYFMGEGNVLISIRSFLTRIPATETLETIEPCIIHRLTHAELKLAYEKFPSFQRHRAELLEKYYLLSEEREDMRQQKSKIDRFRFLLEHYPHLINRVPDKYLASFIDTTPQYFSDLKRRFNKGL
jgi:CRP-like cAMP-binding protein